MGLVQVSCQRVDLRRQPRDAPIVLELELESHERVVQVDHRWTHDYRERKTVDHVLDVWIETRLGPAAAPAAIPGQTTIDDHGA